MSGRGPRPLGEACASTGWVAAFCVERNRMMAQFPNAAQDEIFALPIAEVSILDT
jgi:hypothetical protein